MVVVRPIVGKKLSVLNTVQHRCVARGLSPEKARLTGVSRDFVQEGCFSCGDWEVGARKTREGFQGLYASKHVPCTSPSIPSLLWYDPFLVLVSGSFASTESAGWSRVLIWCVKGCEVLPFFFLTTVSRGIDVGVPQSCSAPLRETPGADWSTNVSTTVVLRGLLGGSWRFFFWLPSPRFGKSFQTVPFVDSDISLVLFAFCFTFDTA